MIQTLLTTTKTKAFQNLQQEINNVTVTQRLSASRLSLNINKTKYVLTQSNFKQLSDCSKTLRHLKNTELQLVINH